MAEADNSARRPSQGPLAGVIRPESDLHGRAPSAYVSITSAQTISAVGPEPRPNILLNWTASVGIVNADLNPLAERAVAMTGLHPMLFKMRPLTIKFTRLGRGRLVFLVMNQTMQVWSQQSTHNQEGGRNSCGSVDYSAR